MQLHVRVAHLARCNPALRPHLLRVLTASQSGSFTTTATVGELIPSRPMRNVWQDPAGWAYEAPVEMDPGGGKMTVFVNAKFTEVGLIDQFGHGTQMNYKMERMFRELTKAQAKAQGIL